MVLIDLCNSSNNQSTWITSLMKVNKDEFMNSKSCNNLGSQYKKGLGWT